MQFNDIDIQTLALRIDKLEATNHRWKLASALLLLSGVSLFLLAAKPADRVDPDVLHVRTVEAQEFVLKDVDGRVHARLSLNPGRQVQVNGRTVIIAPGPVIPGQVALQFYDERGQILWTAPAEPQLVPVK